MTTNATHAHEWEPATAAPHQRRYRCAACGARKSITPLGPSRSSGKVGWGMIGAAALAALVLALFGGA